AQIRSTGGGGGGVGFAVPVDSVKRSLAELKSSGHVAYAYLGVSTEQLYPQLAQRLGLSVQHGALVATVDGGGPAKKAGIQAGKGKITFQGAKDIPSGGDVIVSVDGRPVSQAADMTVIIGMTDPRATVTLGMVTGHSR